MTYYTIMSTTKAHHNRENELIFERAKKKIYRGFQSLLWEITENYRRVSGLCASAWVLCSSYICTFQYTIQEYLYELKQELKLCERDLVYEPSFSSRMWRNITFLPNKKVIQHTDCICNKSTTKVEQLKLKHNANAVTSWLRRKRIRVSFDDVTPWNDGTLMWEILKRISDRRSEIPELDSSKRIENWSLLGSIIKHRYPGLIQNKLLLRCLVTSDSVCLQHVIYILTRIMDAHRRTWRGYLIMQIINTADIFKGLLQPRFHVSGPGIIHAKVNMKNEFVIRSEYICPSFTIEIQDSDGEIWRDNTSNAKLSNNHDDEYQPTGYSSLTECEKPLEVVRVSRYLYRIFYVIRTQGNCKISVRTGVNRGGHIHGSPFYVNTHSGFQRQMDKNRSNENSPSLGPSTSATPRKRLTGMSAVHGDGMGNLHGSSTANAAKTDCDDALSEDESYLTPPKSRPGLRKMTVTILRQIGTGISSVSHRVVSTIRKSASDADSGTSKPSLSKRKTHASVFLCPNVHDRRTNGNGLHVPSSRNFKIRSVTIHRFLNKPMPSLEEYFFGHGGFSVDSENECPGSGKRWNNIASLLRAKMRMMSRSSVTAVNRESSEKRRVADNIGLHRRRFRLRRSENIYESPRLRSRHSSDDIFWRKTGRKLSSSSSEDDRDVFDDDDIIEEKVSSLRIENSELDDHVDSSQRQKAPLTDDGARFHQIFRDEGGAADLLLHNTTTSLSSYNSQETNIILSANNTKTQETKTRHSSDFRVGYEPCKESKAKRRSGFVMCQQSKDHTSTERITNDIDLTYLEFAEKTARTVMKMAGEEYTKHKSTLPEHNR